MALAAAVKQRMSVFLIRDAFRGTANHHPQASNSVTRRCGKNKNGNDHRILKIRMRIESQPVFQKRMANSALPANNNARVRVDCARESEVLALVCKAGLEASVNDNASVG